MLGIVILNYRTYNDTIECIENISNNQIVEEYKIYVVDNASPNDSYKILEARYRTNSTVKVIQSGKNGGFSYGNNVGFRIAIEEGCDKILCTNNDVFFKPQAINLMCYDLNVHDECAVVGPKVYCTDGDIQNGTRRILTLKRFFMRHKPFSLFDWFGVEKKYTYQDYKYESPIYVEGMVSGCCFIIRATALNEVGLLDENVFLYNEEQILAAKLRHVGYKIRLLPEAEIVHFGGKTTGGKNAFLRYHTFYGTLYYFWNYTKISKISFALLSFYIKTLFCLKSITCREYRSFYKLIKTEIKKLKHSQRKMKRV